MQKPSTDTIAVDMKNKPFRNDDGSFLFRPGGHGALIENLNDVKGDIIFIKNIDNVVPDRLKYETYTYKKVIGSYLTEIQKKIFEYLKILANSNINKDTIIEITDFAEKKLNMIFSPVFNNYHEKEKIKYLSEKLNRPVRVCGMVRNEGEPGGGPFWVKDAEGNSGLQIIESSQVNLNDPGQKEIFKASTHFNPVDIVCGVKDYKGDNFNLKNFIDHSTGFITKKSKDGRDLKAQELPGLWNGAMAKWITIFVEVPLITFNPVKTVNDLLRKEHQ